MKLLTAKKGQVISSLQSFIMGIVTIGVILCVGLYILSSVKTSMIVEAPNCGLNSTGGTGGTIGYSNCSASYNATGDIITKLGAAPTWIGLLIVVVFASAILGYFYVKGR